MNERHTATRTVEIACSIPITIDGLKSRVIYNTKFPHLIDVVWRTLTQNHFMPSINVQTETIAFINDPFALLQIHFT